MLGSKFIKLFTLLFAVAVAGVTFSGNTAFAAGFDDIKLIQTVYHVSVDGEEIGVVKDKNAIKQVIREVTEKAEEQHPGISFTIAQNITYKADKVFLPETNTTEVLVALRDKLTVRAQGALLVVGDKEVGYFKSYADAREVLQTFKDKYVPEETLKQSDGKHHLKKVHVARHGDGFKHIKLSEEITIKETKVKSEELLTVEEGVEILQKGTTEQKVYEVQKGDTLLSIASEHDMSVEELLKINPQISEDEILSIGTELKITVPEPLLKVIVKRAVTEKQEIPFDTKIKEDDSLLKGVEETIQEGSNGSKKVTYVVTKANGKVVNKKVVGENVLEKSIQEIIRKGTKVIPSRGTGSFVWPTVGGYVSSYMGPRWGSYHKGIDIAGPSSRAILAADNGRVVQAGYDDGGYGNRVVIDHNNGIRTTYSHLASIHVSVGEVVAKGEQIGVMGATGHVTGVHLHFEVMENGGYRNPMDYLN